jgi:hypothetical protein
MSDIADLSHLYGNDLALTASGDIAVVTAANRTIQRVIRRLCTAATSVQASSYPWEPDYGAGLPARVGQTFDPRLIAGIIRSQLLAEPSVAQIPAPQISLTNITANAATCNIRYTDANGQQQGAKFNLLG